MAANFNIKKPSYKMVINGNHENNWTLADFLIEPEPEIKEEPPIQEAQAESSSFDLDTIIAEGATAGEVESGEMPEWANEFESTKVQEKINPDDFKTVLSDMEAISEEMETQKQFSKESIESIRPSANFENIDTIKKDLKKYIGDNKIDELFESLDNLISPNSSMSNGLILQKSRYESLKRYLRKGVISDEEANLNLNKTNYALLNFIDELREEDLTDEISKINRRNIKASASISSKNISRGEKRWWEFWK